MTTHTNAQRVLSFIKNHPSSNRGTIATKLGIDKTEVSVILHALSLSGKIKMEGSKKGASYKV